MQKVHRDQDLIFKKKKSLKSLSLKEIAKLRYELIAERLEVLQELRHLKHLKTAAAGQRLSTLALYLRYSQSLEEIFRHELSTSAQGLVEFVFDDFIEDPSFEVV